MAERTDRALARSFRIRERISATILWVSGIASGVCLLLLIAAAFDLGPMDLRTGATLTALFFAVFSFFFRSVEAERQSRKQHTIKILFDTRLSTEFRQHLEYRRLHFPEDEPVLPGKYLDYIRSSRDRELSDEDAFERRKSAEGMRSLLNYYEFIALGIETGDLHEEMLKGSIRGIMCNLVRDAHPLLVEIRADNARAYEHLAALYERWRDPEFPSLA